jgi:hypothetical protein
MAILVFPHYQSDPSRKQSEKKKKVVRIVALCQDWSIYLTLIFHRMALAHLGFYYPFFPPFQRTENE